MKSLTNEIRPYAWGSRVALARLRGASTPAPGPEAELWMGGHPSAPSRLPDGAPLAPLPFLLKLLAADSPLSIQAHPSPEQAAAGFAAGDPNYVDPYHKPELLVALEPFEALCGFAPLAVSQARLAKLPGLSTILAEGDLRSAVSALLAAPPALVAAVASVDPLVARLDAAFPGDPGCLVALLLNQVTLAPDEAVFMPAGNLHAYLHGFGVEIMAASDNVLRGGLTPKRVDVPALLSILRFEPLPDPVVRSLPLGPGLVTWPVPVRDFRLVKATAPATLPGGGPRIIVGVAGTVTLTPGAAPAGAPPAGAALTLRPGESVFVAADEGAVTIDGVGTVFQASAGPSGG